MERVNVYRFYTLGHTLHSLSGIKAADNLQEHYYALLSAQKWLEYALKDHLMALSVSRPACSSLLGAIKTLLEPEVPKGAANGTAASLNMDKEIGPFCAFSITSGLQTLENALAAELQSVDTYRVSIKLAYETRLLIEEGDKLLPDNIRAQVPAVTVQELKQAGKCIASDTPTAACFHLI